MLIVCCLPPWSWQLARRERKRIRTGSCVAGANCDGACCTIWAGVGGRFDHRHPWSGAGQTTNWAIRGIGQRAMAEGSFVLREVAAERSSRIKAPPVLGCVARGRAAGFVFAQLALAMAFGFPPLVWSIPVSEVGVLRSIHSTKVALERKLRLEVLNSLERRLAAISARCCTRVRKGCCGEGGSCNEGGGDPLRSGACWRSRHSLASSPPAEGRSDRSVGADGRQDSRGRWRRRLRSPRCFCMCARASRSSSGVVSPSLRG